jgi:hypothetical protein
MRPDTEARPETEARPDTEARSVKAGELDTNADARPETDTCNSLSRKEAREGNKNTDPTVTRLYVSYSGQIIVLGFISPFIYVIRFLTHSTEQWS